MVEFQQVYEEHFPYVYRYVLALCQNPSVAEEVTQETFFKAIKTIDKFSGNCKVNVWLCQIAKNTYFSLYEKQKKISNLPNEQISDNFDLLETFINKEDSIKIHKKLHAMNQPYKEVLTLRIFGELPFSQIGELFGKSDSWARLIFYRGKKQLQEDL